tara:strand:- start:683 stop:1219 length:537 start_codon:yes stop_codon:yes gene_type:complete
MEEPLPLAVDMDGTLILSDMSAITIKRVLLPRPWLLIPFLIKEFTGRRPLWKKELGARLKFKPSELDYHDDFLAWLTEERKRRKEIVLCTASTIDVAQKVADYVGLFDGVMATEDGPNLAAENKRKALVERYGEKGFGYAGNSKDDLKVWPSAGEVIVVNASSKTRKQIESDADRIFD